MYGQQRDMHIVYTQEDLVIFSDYVQTHIGKKEMKIGELIIHTGKYFLGSPYVAATLDTPVRENLVVNLREFDCTTFVETCLALAFTIKDPIVSVGENMQENFDVFCYYLEKVRYRHGEMTDYTSRLHYFSDWIYDNEQKHIVKDITSEIGGKKKIISVNYMSTHPESYKQLVADPALVPEIKKTEENINSRNGYSYVPKTEIQGIRKEIQDGDIMAFTTSIAGLDISHVGYAVRINGELHLMHASLSGKVLITKQSLVDYTMSVKRQDGTMVARPECCAFMQY